MEYKFEHPVSGSIGTGKFQCTIQWRNGKIIADEPGSSGGKDTGPDPTSLLLASLASCKLITMRMYIDRKGWNIPEFSVQTNLYEEKIEEEITTVIDVAIVMPREVDEKQRARLQEISKKCPISKMLEGNIKIRTFRLREGGK